MTVPHRLPLVHLGIFLLILASLSCQISAGAGLSPARVATLTTSPEFQNPASWISVYFTDPASPSSQSLRGGPDGDLAEAIRAARAGVDVAVLQLNLWSVRDALLEAHRRGVRVRMVTDSDYLDIPEVQTLIEAGISVRGDRREGLMHNKFVVIDRQEVWTGSMNFTISEAYRNNNTLVRIRSTQLAQNYTAEFEEIFAADQFGPDSPADTPNPLLTIDGTQVENCFSPDDGCTARLRALVERASRSILFLAYSFTSDELAEALIESAARGVTVQGVMESSQVASNQGTEWALFRLAGLDVRKDSNPNQMHEKVILIDDQIVALGSFNFTYSAETRNDENLLIFHNSQIAALYRAEFEHLFSQAVGPE